MTFATSSRTSRGSMVIALLLALTACSTDKSFKTYHDYNPNVDFRAFKTFSFISDHPMVISAANQTVNPLLEGRIMGAIQRDLTAKGFSYVADRDNANMVVSFTIGSRDQVRVDQYPSSYQMGYGNYYRPYGYGMAMGTETRVRQYTEGQLTVDIFDVKTKTPAYHGSSSTRINDSDREDPETLINQIVDETLNGFPPGSSNISKPNLIPLDSAVAP